MIAISQANAILIFLLAIAGSFINIPLGRKKIVLVEQPYFFGLFKKSHAVFQGVSINVGGAIIPVILATYFLFHLPLKPTLLAVFLTIGAAKMLSRYIPNKGVVLSPFWAAFFSIFFAFVFVPQFVAHAAFVTGVFGVIVGADLLNIPRILKEEGGGILSIGGAGVFDGIFLIGVLSALLAGL